jgi:hypothetical protein
MTSPKLPLDDSLLRLIDAACNGAISDEQFDQLEAALAASEEARRLYLRLSTLEGDLHYLVSVTHADEATIVPPIVLDLSPALPSPLFTLHSPVGGFMFSYMMAAVIVAVGLLVGGRLKVSRDQQVAVDSSLRSPAAFPPEKESRIVGRITGMVDCRWAGLQGRTSLRDGVPLGQRYALAAGVVQITYDTGANVILQGPCAYDVDSPSGGFLSRGKLTARVEREDRKRDHSRRSTLDTRLSTHNSPLFSVRTPTAVVTDLGTEFGVDVNEEGTTTSLVFRGSVRVRLVGDDAGRWDAVLREGESAKAMRNKGNAKPQLVLRDTAGNPPKFVRRLVEPPKVLDLLDIVAGGNGTGRRRERGIDLATGVQDTFFIGQGRDCDRRYRPTAWHKLIDGVFVPNGGAGPVQLDSAGHTFDGFPRTSGRIWGGIWARAADVKPDRRAEDSRSWVYIMGRRDQFTPEGRGLLCLHANAGVTFKIEALRELHPGSRPARLSATVGLAGAGQAAEQGLVDFRIFADGRLIWSREKIVAKDGPLPLEVEIGPGVRFLTLAVTDGGNGITADWFVLGDPVLRMASTEYGTPARGGAEHVPHDSLNTNQK